MINGLEVNGKRFEVEVLTENIASSISNFAVGALAQYAQEHWTYDKETERYSFETLKDRKDFAYFDARYFEFLAILQSDKNMVFEDVGELFEFTKNEPDNYPRLCELVFETNPTLKPVTKNEVGKDPN